MLLVYRGACPKWRSSVALNPTIDMYLDILLILAGLGLLYFGGNLLISGCLRIAHSYKVSPFVIGATIMGFGTSAPELAVSLQAAFKGLRTWPWATWWEAISPMSGWCSD